MLADGTFYQTPLGFYLMLLSLTLTVCGFALYFRERQRSLKLQAELQQLHLQASQNLVHDNSTGLLTRVGFEAALAQAIHKVDSGGGAVCVLCIALDNFGLLNDAFGQNLGDKVLQDISQRLASAHELHLQSCRLAATEFAVLLQGNASVGRMAAEHVRHLVAEPIQVEPIRTSLSCSIGIAEYPKHGSSAVLMTNAALAMRSVKLNGGDDFCLYDHKLGIEAREQSMLINDSIFQIRYEPERS